MFIIIKKNQLLLLPLTLQSRCNFSTEPPSNNDYSNITFESKNICADKNLTPTCGSFPPREILEINGNGIAVFDADQDDDLDVFIANGATLNSPTKGPGWMLFLQSKSMEFIDSSSESQIALQDSWGSGVACGDIDADGDLDLIVSTWGNDLLLRNNGEGIFNSEKNILGMMPHPERMIDQSLSGEDGSIFFENLLKNLK